MPINKDLIVKVIFSFIFIGVSLRVLIPILYEYFIRKIPGSSEHSNDIDIMIRRQKERLRSQYGLYGEIHQSNSRLSSDKSTEDSPPKLNSELQQVMKENQWGESPFVKDIQKTISKNYAYTISEKKIQLHLSNCEKIIISHF